jgi:hypothetical protein
MAATPSNGSRRRIARIAAALACAAATWALVCAIGCGGSPDAASMEAEVSAALREPETLARTARLVPLLQQLTPENVSGAAAAFEARLSVVEDADLRLFLHAWAAFDPQAALDRTQAWSMEARRQFGAGAVAYYWAWHGGGGDVRFNVDSISESSVRRAARSKLVEGWARSGDYEGITDYVAELDNSDLRDRFVAIIVAAIIANDDVDGVVRWVEALPDDAHDKFKRTAFRKALRHVTARDPEVAARWYERHADAFYSDLGMPIVATEWVEQDAAAALEWLRMRPHAGQRDMAIQMALRRWLALDAASAEAWMRSGAWEGGLEPSIEPFSIWLAKTDPAEAIEWAERIADPAQRQRAFLIAGKRLRRRDPEAFEAWFASAELSDATRRTLERNSGAGRARMVPSAQREEPSE